MTIDYTAAALQAPLTEDQMAALGFRRDAATGCWRDDAVLFPHTEERPCLSLLNLLQYVKDTAYNAGRSDNQKALRTYLGLAG
jgi:hypothetical protein